jgi:hypothetical protein
MRRIALLLGLAVLAGCAPRRTAPVEVTRDAVRERFDAKRASRAERAAGFEAQLLVWTRIGSDKLPGMEARVLLASPERARVRVASAFGTAADLVLRGDTAIAYVPSRREMVRTYTAGDSLGVRDPARWLVSALTATWSPPDDAWSTADRRDSVVRLTWREDDLVRELDIGGSGLPRAARVRGENGVPLEIRYDGWIGAGGASWPARGTLTPGDGRWSASWRLERHRPIGTPDDSRFQLAWPKGVRRVSLSELRATIDEAMEAYQ